MARTQLHQAAFGLLAATWALGSTMSSALAQSAVEGVGVGNYVALPEDPSKAHDITQYGVLDRPRPGYDAVGLPMGSFRLYPYLIGAVAFDDNVYSASSSAQKKSDFISRVSPGLELKSDWSRHSLNAYAAVEGVYYRDLTGEDQVNGKAGFSGTVDVMRDLRLRYFGDWARLHEDRGATSSATSFASNFDSPVVYDKSSFGIAVDRRFNRVALTVATSYDRTEYGNASISGVAVDQGYRNYEMGLGKVRLGYEFSPSATAFVEAAVDRRNYFSTDLDSSGTRAVVGFSGELSRLVRGEVFAGYMGRQYDNTSIGSINAFAYGGVLNWYITPLLTLVMTGERNVNEGKYVVLGTYLQSKVGVRADYELMRNVIVSGRVGYEWDKYQQVDRRDEILTAGVSATYLINQNLKLSLDYRYADRKSNNDGLDYARNIIGLTAKVQY